MGGWEINQWSLMQGDSGDLCRQTVYFSIGIRLEFLKEAMPFALVLAYQTVETRVKVCSPVA